MQQINDASVYLADNGIALCGQHLGTSARTTGRDLSGQPIMLVTSEIATISFRDGFVVSCERCGLKAGK